MQEVLRLAKRGLSWTWPNPLVGAVLVKNGKIIGKGYHKKVGFPHAEIEAIRNANVNLRGATLYVNLEPCVHFGKTSPCVGAIIKSGITRVVCSVVDPNPQVAGKGIEKLRQTGIDVSVGVLEQEAKKQNAAFFAFHEKKRPFVAIKFAASLDGKIATRSGDAKWITNEKARQYARGLRSWYQAVLVGVNTVIADDPHLGARQKGKKDPVRIVLDSMLRIPLDSQVLRDTNVIIATTENANKKKRSILIKKGITIIDCGTSAILLKQLLFELVHKEIMSILVEGGGKTIGSFLDEKLVDKIYAFHAPILIGGEKAVSIGGLGAATIKESFQLQNVVYRRFDDNMLTTGYIA